MHMALSNKMGGCMYLMVQGEITADHEFAAHCIQNDSTHALGPLASLSQVPQRLLVILH